MSSLLRAAEAAGRRRCAAILDRVEAAAARHAGATEAIRSGDALRLRGPGLRRRWIEDAALRFASRIAR